MVPWKNRILFLYASIVYYLNNCAMIIQNKIRFLFPEFLYCFCCCLLKKVFAGSRRREMPVKKGCLRTKHPLTDKNQLN